MRCLYLKAHIRQLAISNWYQATYLNLVLYYFQFGSIGYVYPKIELQGLEKLRRSEIFVATEYIIHPRSSGGAGYWCFLLGYLFEWGINLKYLVFNSIG